MPNKTVDIALMIGDGIGPELMPLAGKLTAEAAERLDGVKINWIPAPVGCGAYEKYGDTFPRSSYDTAMSTGLVFFGGVGDPKFDETVGLEHPEMKPEPRILKPLRKDLGLLVNHRPVVFLPSLAASGGVNPMRAPKSVVTVHCMRQLLMDAYFGNEDLGPLIDPETAAAIGFKQKAQVTGLEDRVSMLSYLDRDVVERFMHYDFKMARQLGLPVICVDKANMETCSEFWRKICKRLQAEYYPDVVLKFLYIDAATAAVFVPERLRGVVIANNLYGDILSDTVAGAVSMGMMCSSSVNTETGAALFERGAGSAPDIAGQNIANPIGCFLTGSMLNRHIGAPNAANAIERAINLALEAGCRTRDIYIAGVDRGEPLSTTEMAAAIASYL